MRIIVIGAGIVGLATSYWLARDGHEVTIVDRGESVGQGASFANGGQLSYDYVAPLADPSVLRSLPRWLMGAASPVKFRPAVDDGQLSWVLSFLMACTGKRRRATTRRLLALASADPHLQSLETVAEVNMGDQLLVGGHVREASAYFSSARDALVLCFREIASVRAGKAVAVNE